MALLVARRPGSTRFIKFDKRPLQANIQVFSGGLAAAKAGFFGPATGDPDEIVVGRFYESVSNLGGAAGDKSANIQFFRQRELYLLDNDGVTPVTVAMRERPVSLSDDHTAVAFTPAKGTAAICYDVTSEGVWIDFISPASADDAGLPAIQAGTTTLVAGTRTVSNVSITANSRILLTMKDPGAGALTTFIALDAPAGSRTPGAAGSFVINAIDNAKAVLATAVCTVDYLIIG